MDMSLRNARRQKSEQQPELPLEYRGEAPNVQRSVESLTAANGSERTSDDYLMEKVVKEGNKQLAIKRVKQNKGSPGIDGMSTEELPRYLEGNWIRIREELLTGTYQPQMVKRVEIPKATGGVRQLGIPTVVDRMIQQMILNVLQPKIDPTFSEHSYGFRPGRSAHRAVREAQGYIQDGRRWGVDVDLEKFFDRVNHDILMSRLAETPGVFAELDEWIGRRLRMVRLKQWKRGTTIFRELRSAGVSKNAAASVAACHRCWWKMAGTSAFNMALPNPYFAKLGVPRLAN